MPEDVFFKPAVADLWESTSDIIGDAQLARSVMEHLAVGFWNMSWDEWQALAGSAVAKEK